MSGLLFVISIVFFVGFATGMTTEEFDEWEGAWRTAICDHYDVALIEELEECNKLAKMDMDESFGQCQSKAFPESSDPAEFMKAGCADNTIFDKYDECLLPHREDEAFLEQIGESIEALKCSIEVMKKYDGYNENLEYKSRK